MSNNKVQILWNNSYLELFMYINWDSLCENIEGLQPQYKI